MGTVFWDLDGTLVDPKVGITGSVIKALNDMGLEAPTPDDLEWVIGPALLWSFEKLGAPDPQKGLELYRKYYTGGGMYDCTVYDGIPEALGLIGRSHTMNIATAKPHVYARKLTAHLGLAQYMAHEFGPEMDGTRNDKSELLANALELTGDDVRHCVMIGDRHYDMDAARTVGMKFIAVSWGYGGSDDLSGADLTVHAPGDLPGAINQLLGA